MTNTMSITLVTIAGIIAMVTITLSIVRIMLDITKAKNNIE